jgi:hypothetical protein
MKYLCSREEDGGLGYRETANNIVSNGLFIPAHLAEFISSSEPDIWQLYDAVQQLAREMEIKLQNIDESNLAPAFLSKINLVLGGQKKEE